MRDTIAGVRIHRHNSPDDAADSRTRDDLAKAYQQSADNLLTAGIIDPSDHFDTVFRTERAKLP